MPKIIVAGAGRVFVTVKWSTEEKGKHTLDPIPTE